MLIQPKMTREEQAKFVEELTSNVAKHVIERINDNRIPENWDGFELRELLADKFREEAYILIIHKSRMRDYRNTVLVNNI